MDSDWDEADEDAFEGPDGIAEEEEDLDLELEDRAISANDDDAALGILSSPLSLFAGDPGREGSVRITRSAHGPIRLLRVGNLFRVFVRGRDEEESASEAPPVNESQKAGLDLLMGGEFGRIGMKTASQRKAFNIARILNNPPIRFRPPSYKEDISGNLVPNCNGTAVATYDTNVYSGQFSADSSLYYTCAQDYRLRVYDTRAAPTTTDNLTSDPLNTDHSHKSTMKVHKTIQGQLGRWTITDSHLSPDDQRIIYSSITPTVYMATTLDSSTTQIPIPFAECTNRPLRLREDFGIWSCRFSADGNEVIAGGDGKLFVYDLLAGRRTVRITAHDDDVNSCCWADTASGNVLISASDDTFLKVWDRRSLGTGQKPSGILVGHTEGITYVSAKGDGRYVISNGKDQALRLWDLRKMRSSAEFDGIAKVDYRSGFDYRYEHPPKRRPFAHPQDCSVMTYRGHSVLVTLIRCHFSPVETTGAQYLYSGSSDGKIHIWSLDGRVVQVLDRAKALPLSVDPSAPEPPPRGGFRTNICVRDVSWHSQEPVMMSTGWNRDREGSVIARHEWKGLSKMHGSLEDWVERQKQEQPRTSRPSRRLR